MFKCLFDKTYTYTANKAFFPIFLQKIKAPSYCGVLWNITPQNVGRDKSDLGHGRVQRKLEKTHF